MEIKTDHHTAVLLSQIR